MCKNFTWIGPILLLFLSLQSTSQNTRHTYNTVWFRVFLADKITDKLHWDLMLQHRREATTRQLDFLEKKQLQSYWLWFHYSLPKNFKISVSPFCYFETRHL